MKKSLLAIAGVLLAAIVSALAAGSLAVRAATPAPSIAFPGLTTIYIVSGVTDTSLGNGTATTFHCTNVSGATASVRYLALDKTGAVLADEATQLDHGETATASTRATNAFNEDLTVATGVLAQGVVNIESTQSGVFCSGMILDAAATQPVGIDLHMVRVNPHPGTVE